jgi:hypothetical protein
MNRSKTQSKKQNVLFRGAAPGLDLGPGLPRLGSCLDLSNPRECKKGNEDVNLCQVLMKSRLYLRASLASRSSKPSMQKIVNASIPVLRSASLKKVSPQQMKLKIMK